MLVAIVCVVIFVITVGLLFFNYGPYILTWFFDTLEEWQDVINSVRDKE